ncbi:MAG: hypothetical protein NT150_03350 [Bacteroidetes bacterium]|nr:hypothetical protein [Bacteroidota bacterium]
MVKSCFIAAASLLFSMNLLGQANVHMLNVRVDSSVLSEEMKMEVVRNYIYNPVGGWMKFDVLGIKERQDKGQYLSKLSKERCSIISAYLKELEIEEKDILVKYEPYASLWVFKAKELQRTNCKTTLDSNIRQCFGVSKSHGGTWVSANGISFYFPPYCFESKGTLSDKVEVCVYEYLSKQDFVMSGLVARSKGKILESMGMFYVEAKCEGIKLELKGGSSMNIIFPKQLAASDGYFTFNGENRSGLVDWKLDGLRRVISPVIKDSLSTQKVSRSRESDSDWEGEGVYLDGDYNSEQQKALYSIMSSSKLGWINCDRFIEVNNKVNIACVLENAPKAEVYLVFKSMNSILPLYNSGKEGLFYAKDLPDNEEVMIISFTNDKGNFKLGYASLNSSQKEVVKLKLDSYSTVQFKAVMSDLLAY